MRLALGAHLFPGSSLHGYKFASADFKVGKADVPIPVKEILPQSLSKTMEATQLAGSPFSWTVSKSPSQATYTFPDTCDLNNPKSLNLSISVTWEQVAGAQGDVLVTTKVYATNPAARVITTNVHDVISEGGSPIDTADSGAIDVPANTANFLVLTHTKSVTPGDPDFSDVATATYTDKLTGIPVPGQTTATASATITLAAFSDATATVTDSEALDAGSPFLFSTDSFDHPIGQFQNGYVATTKVPTPYAGPVVWTSDSQSTGNSVTFQKTVYVSGAVSGTSNLSDTATVNGDTTSDLAHASASVTINANAFVKLTVNKSVDLNPSGASFTFDVYDGANFVKSATINLAAGVTSGSTDVTGLMPGTNYTVKEEANSSYNTDTDKSKTINLPTCSGSVSFTNTYKVQDATIIKTATPTFTRTYAWSISKSVDKTKVDVTGADAVFNYTVHVAQTGVTDSAWHVAGTITVNNPNPFNLTGATITDAVDNGGNCSVTGGTSATLAPGNNNFAYSCSYPSGPSSASGTNTAHVAWTGPTSGSASYPLGFAFTTPTTATNKTVNVTDSLEGSLGSVTATDSAPFTSTDIKYHRDIAGTPGSCQTYNNTATITETGQHDSKSVQVCEARIILLKYTRGGVGTFTFPIGGGPTTPTTLSITTQGSPDGTGTVTEYVLPGNYTAAENPLAGWLLTDFACTAGSVTQTSQLTGTPTQWTFPVPSGGTVTCTFTNSGRFTTRTQGFWATHTVLANNVWNGGIAGVPAVYGSPESYLCGVSISAIPQPGQNQMMGGFWSGVSKTSAGKTRSSIDQARMQFLQQYLAAVLNVHMFGGGAVNLTTARAAYCGTNANAISQQAGILGAYNNSGDSGTFTPGMSATSQTSKSQANIPFWDITIH